MIFTELRFLAFFAVVFAVHWALRGLTARKVWLTAASYFFYGCWDWRFLSLILVSTVVDWFAGRHIAASDEARVRKRWLTLSLVANVGLLATFKYLGFFVDSAVDLCALLGIDVTRPTLEIVLPVGISFYTFQTLSYTHRRLLRGHCEPRKDVPRLLSFFVSVLPPAGRGSRWSGRATCCGSCRSPNGRFSWAHAGARVGHEPRAVVGYAQEDAGRLGHHRAASSTRFFT